MKKFSISKLLKMFSGFLSKKKKKFSGLKPKFEMFIEIIEIKYLFKQKKKKNVKWATKCSAEKP